MYYYFDETRITAIADVIREKLGIDNLMTVAEMPSLINEIGGSGGSESYIPISASVSESIGGSIE